MVLGGLYQRLFVWPVVLVRPARRAAVVSAYMRMMSRMIHRLIRLGGARTRWRGPLPTGAPALLVMNHQSLLDIPTAVLMGDPYSPWFITRRRYGRYVPAVSLCIRLLGCPLIEPRERRESLLVLREAARTQTHGILIFPEGHRTLDGDVQEFKTAGVVLMLRERSVPVYLVVTDGYWTCRRLVDFVFDMHKIDGYTEVLGPFEPGPGQDLGEFLEEMRERMVAHLKGMRERAGASA
jgi:1-acyl-sn-glycerol-3-phosphate acyltransferase